MGKENQEGSLAEKLLPRISSSSGTDPLGYHYLKHSSPELREMDDAKEDASSSAHAREDAGMRSFLIMIEVSQRISFSESK